MSQHPDNQTLQADILLVTVTETETMAVRNAFPEKGWQFIGDKAYYDFGEIGGAKVVLVQSEKGSVGEGGSTRTVDKAIDLLSPSFVIMVGIAFGFDPDQRKIGDILVSQQILNYEMQRVSQGHNQLRQRGDQVTVSAKMLNRFRHGAMEWKKAKEPAKVEFGILLSGAKLIDNPEFRDQVREFAPEAIGGEMEGEGVYAAAQGHRVDWILVKTICDWADGVKHDNEPPRQEFAADIAARFVLSVITQGGFRSERPQNAPNAPVLTSASAQPPQAQDNPQERSTPQPTRTIRWKDIQKTLRFRLGELFPQEQSIRSLVRDIDDTLQRFVIWGGNAIDCWSGILEQVRLRHLELDLIDAALEYYPQDAILKKAKDDIKTLDFE